jgi:hypothetical protein
MPLCVSSLHEGPHRSEGGGLRFDSLVHHVDLAMGFGFEMKGKRGLSRNQHKVGSSKQFEVSRWHRVLHIKTFLGQPWDCLGMALEIAPFLLPLGQHKCCPEDNLRLSWGIKVCCPLGT